MQSKVEKVVIGSQVCYVYKGSNYIERPKLTADSYTERFIYDDTENITYIYIRKKSVLPYVIILLATLILFGYASRLQKPIITVNYSDTVYCHDDYISLNISNKTSEVSLITATVLYKKEPVTKHIKLKEKEAVSNVPLTKQFNVGEYDCELELVASNGILNVKEVLSIRLIVK